MKEGNWIGIDETEKFTPASLLKLPLLIAYYKNAENNPQTLTQNILYSDSSINTEFTQNIVPSEKLTLGKFYTVDDLINRMIMYSDNTATVLLSRNIKNEKLTQIYQDLRIYSPEDFFNSDSVSTKQYSMFFRVLYNSTYLNNYYSEKALNLLTNSNYKDGIAGGLPSNIVIAHKFGERDNLVSKQKQLHDCGIIYIPNNPYLLCIMTKGTSFPAQAEQIKKISGYIYDYIKNNSLN